MRAVDEYYYEFDGVTINPGELATFHAHHPLQRSVLPLYAKIGHQVRGIGTAVPPMRLRCDDPRGSRRTHMPRCGWRVGGLLRRR